MLKGSLSAVKDVVLTGKFEGELQTLGRLTVTSGAVATGSINAGSLVLEPGNLVEARIQIAPPPKSAFKTAETATEKVGGIWSKIKSVFGKK
jgi:cytoskeletal protein CcmA (bactofilin family)